MSYSPLLAPVVALVAWTLVVMAWMAATLLAAFQAGQIKLEHPAGSAGANLDGKVPTEAQWKSHNYIHLMEQPTIFYAIVFALALMGMDQPINHYLAWGYVGLRMLHSLIQCTVEHRSLSLPLFLLASLCVLGLTVHAGARIC